MDKTNVSSVYRSIIANRRNALRPILAKILAAPKRFVWEVGCGHGHFLTAFAKEHPDLLCIGVDMESKRIERACLKQDRARLSNLHFIHCEAAFFLDNLPDGAKIAEIYVLFPDPWPKLRHHKHRIIQNDFLSAVARRAEEGARLCFRTDFQPYFADASGVISQRRDWKIVDEGWPFEFETVFQSRADGFHSLVARLQLGPP